MEQYQQSDWSNPNSELDSLRPAERGRSAIPTYTDMVQHRRNKLGSTLGVNHVAVEKENAPKRDRHKLQREATMTYKLPVWHMNNCVPWFMNLESGIGTVQLEEKTGSDAN